MSHLKMCADTHTHNLTVKCSITSKTDEKRVEREWTLVTSLFSLVNIAQFDDFLSSNDKKDLSN